MKTRSEIFETVLCSEAVDAVSERVRAFLTERKMSRRDIARYTMTLEEILLGYMDTGAGELPVRLSLGTKHFRCHIELSVGGKDINIYSQREEEQGSFGTGILKNLGLSPDYSFTNDLNRYTFRLSRRKKSPFIPLILAVLLALVIGGLGMLMQDAVRESILNSFVVPLKDSFLDLLGCIAGPMIFLSVAWGIYGIGDAATLRNIGKKLCGSFIFSCAVLSVLFCLIILPFFDLNFAGGADSSSFSAIFSMLLQIIPKNIFSPFVDGNTLQIIFIAVLVGIALLVLGQKTDFVASVVEQINYLVQFLIEAITKLVPVFIFIVLLNLMWSDMLSQLRGIGKLVAIFFALTVLTVSIRVLFTALRTRVTPMLLFKKCLPTLIIAGTTASSAAAFGSNAGICKDQLGIDEKLVSFGLPLGIVTSKLSSTTNYMVQSIFFAELYGIDISWSWIVIMLITVVILGVATPPIPGGGMASYAVLFTQLGIPAEALAVALACETVFDFVVTAVDQVSIPLILLDQASRLGLVDRQKLIKEK